MPLMTDPRIRRVLRLIAAPAIVALVIAFYFRVATVNNTTVALTLLLVIFGISTWWGLLEATIASLAAVLGFNYYFLPPVGRSRCKTRRIGWRSPPSWSLP
jgi:K+-sensing histidine kinase KdpD